jgi:hypothetical protein
MTTEAITGTYVLHEHLLPCHAAILPSRSRAMELALDRHLG